MRVSVSQGMRASYTDLKKKKKKETNKKNSLYIKYRR